MEQFYESDEPAVNLSTAINLNELRDPNSKGVVFEVDEEQKQRESDISNNYFYQENIANNLYREDENDSSCDESDERSPFERKISKMEDISGGDGGVYKLILSPGAGDVVASDSVVRVHYNGFVEYADEPFDSSRLRDCVERKRLGKGDTFRGFEIALSTMKKGELSQFIFKPEYAFGAMGCPPRIPANALLLYEIELIGFVEKSGVDEFYQMSPTERLNIPFESICKVSKAEKNEAEEYFKMNMFRKALMKYVKSARVLEECHLKDNEEEQTQRKLLLKIYTNVTLCSVKCGEHKRALTYANKTLELDNNHIKALYWKAKAHSALGHFDLARNNLVRAQRIAPSDANIRKELTHLDKMTKQFRAQEVNFCQKMFSQSSLEDTDKKSDAPKDKLDCSIEFKTAFRKKLQEFIEDKDVQEMPFPSYQLSVSEINFMIDTADGMGLDVVQQGSGQHVKFVLKKISK